jgi:hypothetical protein
VLEVEFILLESLFLQEEFLSSPVHSPLSGLSFRSFRQDYGSSVGKPCFEKKRSYRGELKFQNVSVHNKNTLTFEGCL